MWKRFSNLERRHQKSSVRLVAGQGIPEEPWANQNPVASSVTTSFLPPSSHLLSCSQCLSFLLLSLSVPFSPSTQLQPLLISALLYVQHMEWTWFLYMVEAMVGSSPEIRIFLCHKLSQESLPLEVKDSSTWVIYPLLGLTSKVRRENYYDWSQCLGQWSLAPENVGTTDIIMSPAATPNWEWEHHHIRI